MCSIEKYLRKEFVYCGMEVKDKEDLIKSLCEIAGKNSAMDSSLLYEIIQERESHGVTGIGNGVAIPHGRMKNFDEIIILLATLNNPVDYGSIDGEDVKLVFMLLVPEGNNLIYLKLLSQLSIMCNDKNTRISMMNATTSEEMLEIVRDFD